MNKYSTIYQSKGKNFGSSHHPCIASAKAEIHLLKEDKNVIFQMMCLRKDHDATIESLMYLESITPTLID